MIKCLFLNKVENSTIGYCGHAADPQDVGQTRKRMNKNNHQNRRRIIFVLLGLLLLLGGSYGASRWYKISNYRKWLVTVRIGDTEASVIQKMGEPDKLQKRPEPLWCQESNCDHEFLYGHSIPPEWWVVGFSSEGRVVSKTELNSP